MKTAVVMFNLGGPSSLKEVRPYLYRIFSDPEIIKLPNPLRALVAWSFSRLRAKKTRAIFQVLGGKSVLLENSERQAYALEKALGASYRVFISMRYWQPRAEEVVRQIKQYQPDQIILLPLYPQYSSATTGSSLKEFGKFRAQEIPHIPYRVIDSYPQEDGYVQAVADQIQSVLATVQGPYRVLFTAHGIPLKYIQEGDPYQKQVEATVEKVIDALNLPQLDALICYQSRVGFLPWLKPYTIDEIQRACQEKKGIVLVPISFVSENSETLYELDIQYQKLAHALGVPGYYRVPTVSVHPLFIEGLSNLIKENG